ncbi:MAG: xerC [Elusimicrobia bacterium]|nr:MAG: xerC [Elusimicrobiota bacterium]
MGLLRRKGVWYVRISHKGAQHWKSLRSTRRPSAATVAEAKAALWAALKAEPPKPPPPATPVLRAIAEYLAGLEANQRSPAYRVRIGWVLHNAARAIGAPTLTGWTSEAIEAYLHQGLTGTGWAAGRPRGLRPWKKGRTANLHRDQLGFFLRWARDRGMVPAGKVATERVARASEDHYQPRVHDRRAIVRILRACREYDRGLREGRRPWLERAVRVALGTGARMGELMALDWSAVDSRASRVRLIPGKGRQERVVPLGRIAREALAAVPEEFRVGLIFPDWKRKDNLWLRRALAKKGLPPCGWHSFRHSYITALVRAGVPLPVIMELAGHKEIATTMRYVTVDGKDLEAAAGRLPW